MADTHTSENSSRSLESNQFPEVDVVLHCGDFTENGSPCQLEKALTEFGSITAELKLIIAGNHEASLDKDFFLSQGGKTSDHECCKKIVQEHALKYDFKFLEERTHTFTLKSGATFTIYASPYTPKFGVSAFQYESSHDRFNPTEKVLPDARAMATEASIILPGTDIIMTHGPLKYVLDRTNRGDSAGCGHLREAICRVKPKLHCFGHVHPSYGLRRIRWEEFVEPELASHPGQSESLNARNTNGKRETCQEDSPSLKRCLLDEQYYDGMIPVQTFIGKGQAKRKRYASMGVPDAENFKHDTKQTIFVNAAIMDEEGRSNNPPWLVTLQLPIKR
jgi:Icc-related predicted phosphoesterase